jgi:YD repeat-containing protein
MPVGRQLRRRRVLRAEIVHGVGFRGQRAERLVGKAIPGPGIAALNRGQFADLTLVSCASADCATGGTYEDASFATQAFVVNERNGRWGKAIEVPGTAALSTAGFAIVGSVSCASAGNCAVGGYYAPATGGPQVAFVVSEKNGRWGKAIEVPGLTSLDTARLSEVNAVSCPSAGNCVGGGEYEAKPAEYPLILTCPATSSPTLSTAAGFWSVRRACGRASTWRTIAAAALLVAGLAAIEVAPAASASSLPVGTGPVHGGTFLTFSLTDRLQAQVNVGSGNLLVRSTDLVLPGIEGNVTLGADYNSRMIGSSTETGGFGHGWRSRSGIDVRLIANSDGTVTFTAADGVVGVFKPITGTSPTQYTSPGVFKATLVKTSSGWNLTDHGTGQVTAFNSSGHPATITDRNRNVTMVSYNSSGQQIKITSDWGPAAIRVGAIAYGGNGFISSYTQTGTDATTHTVSYGYDSSGNLTSITPTRTRTSTPSATTPLTT